MTIKFKIPGVTLSLALSAFCASELMITSAMVSPCQAMQMGKSINLDFNEFMKSKFVTKDTGLNDVSGKSKEAYSALQTLFINFGTINEQSKSQFFTEIDNLVNKKTIWGRQAAAVKFFVDDKFQGGPLPVNQPIGNVPDPLAWTKTIAKAVNVHFRKVYKDKATSLQCPGDKKVVNRPNHSLAHGLRQGLLALDIVDALNSTTLPLNNPEAKEITQWVKKKISSDSFFRQKIEYTSAFQRTGRESEASSSGQHKAQYEAYERQDAVNFDKDVKQYVGPGKMFKDAFEAQTYKEAILWSTAGEGKIDPLKNEDLKFLRKIFHAAHNLDLRRLPFDTAKGGMGNSFQKNVSGELFGPNSYNDVEKVFIDKLWDRSGEYLRATGDRDRDPSVNNKYDNYNAKTFCDLAYNPDKMAQVLHDTRNKSAVKF